MPKLVSRLGYGAAALTMVAAFLTPFVLMPTFVKGVAATGVHIDEIYSGGEPWHTIDKHGYNIVVHHPVLPSAPLPRSGAFVQLVWTPATALPSHVADEVDVDGDGEADAVVSFDLPSDPTTPLAVTVDPRGPRLAPLRAVTQESFSSMIARVGESVIVRVPLRTPR